MLPPTFPKGRPRKLQLLQIAEFARRGQQVGASWRVGERRFSPPPLKKIRLHTRALRKAEGGGRLVPGSSLAPVAPALQTASRNRRRFWSQLGASCLRRAFFGGALPSSRDRRGFPLVCGIIPRPDLRIADLISWEGGEKQEERPHHRARRSHLLFQPGYPPSVQTFKVYQSPLYLPYFPVLSTYLQRAPPLPLLQPNFPPAKAANLIELKIAPSFKGPCSASPDSSVSLYTPRSSAHKPRESWSSASQQPRGSHPAGEKTTLRLVCEGTSACSDASQLSPMADVLPVLGASVPLETGPGGGADGADRR